MRTIISSVFTDSTLFIKLMNLTVDADSIHLLLIFTEMILIAVLSPFGLNKSFERQVYSFLQTVSVLNCVKTMETGELQTILVWEKHHRCSIFFNSMQTPSPIST